MTKRIVGTTLICGLAMFAGGSAAFAQQATAASPTIATPGPMQPRPAGVSPQGFSVVLVLGDLQGTASSEDVPAAARKALTDMRDFLPYKSYKLLDAAWVMCCGQDGRRGNMARGSTSPGDANSVTQTFSQRDTSSAIQTLRGPEDQEYELKLRTYRIEGSRMFVSFELTNTREDSRSPNDEDSALLKRQLRELEEELTAKRKQIKATPEEIRSLEAIRQALQRRLNGLQAPGERSSFHPPSEKGSGAKSIIETSFTMDVGETVVVGTSRLRAGSKALIALLTAVPPRASGRQ